MHNVRRMNNFILLTKTQWEISTIKTKNKRKQRKKKKETNYNNKTQKYEQLLENSQNKIVEKTKQC